MDALRHARPSFVKAVIENDDAAWRQRTLCRPKIGEGDFGSVTAIDTDETEWTASEAYEHSSVKRSGVAFMDDDPIGISMAAEISEELGEIAFAGAINVQVLKRKQIDRDPSLIGLG